ncbi:MAG: dehydrogenase [Sandaracinus sp.]|nr:dehydrogenase [Sandaracinus sp.]|tara:strand:- start:647 stop:1414 length:768 start_codon:yes stop_codon:yes gene_type:complete
MHQQHPNRVALVTGGNRGIGLQIVKELAGRGLTVVLGSRDLDQGREAAEPIEGDVRAVQLDVTDRASIDAAAESVRRDLGRLDILINNAAISRAHARTGESTAEWAVRSKPSVVPLDDVRTIWETNVFGPLAVYQAMLPLLREAPHANVVNVSSGLGSLAWFANPEQPNREMFVPGYSASKTALNAMTLAMAIELEGTAIRVNAVTPGYTKTNLNNFEGTETVEEGAAEAVRVALLGPDGPTGQFTHATLGEVPW